MLVPCVCQQCGVTFELEGWAVKGGRGKYCSHECTYAARAGTAKPWLLRRVTRTCLACGTEFETGGRAGSKDKTLCSWNCQRQARYRAGKKCNELASLDASYLAGFWDGEGSFGLYGRGGPGASVGFRVTAVGTKELVIAWIKEVTGIGVITHRKPANERNAPQWAWWVHGDGAESFARQLLPYLKLKREHAELGIAFQERLRDPSLKADRAWQEEWRLRMREMNRRGPMLDA